MENDLRSSAKALNDKVQQQEEARESADRKAQEAEQRRFYLLMRGMVQARKSLREMQALDMGDRFQFAIQMEEKNGWPSLTLKLQDVEALDADFPALKISAVEILDKGEIRVTTHEQGAPPLRIEILHELDVATLNKTLKEKIKAYLDFAGDIIEDVLTKGVSPYQHGPKVGPTSDLGNEQVISTMSGEDLFAEEDGSSADILESMSSVEDIEALPGLEK